MEEETLSSMSIITCPVERKYMFACICGQNDVNKPMLYIILDCSKSFLLLFNKISYLFITLPFCIHDPHVEHWHKVGMKIKSNSSNDLSSVQNLPLIWNGLMTQTFSALVAYKQRRHHICGH